MFKELMCPKCEESLHAIIDAMCESYAVHEIICNENDKPEDYRFLEVNDAFAQISGLNREDIVGKTVREIYPDEEAYWIDVYGRVALSGNPVRLEQYRTSSGKYFRVSVFTPRRGKFITLFSEITDFKRNEEALKKHKLLFECAQDAVLYIKSDGMIVDANEAASKLYRYEYKEFLELSIHNIRHGSTRTLFEAQMKVADESGIIFESVHVKKDGTEFPVEVSSRGTKIGEDWIRIHIIRDITERKVSEEKITYLANHDALTGIPNRARLMDELGKAFEYAKRGKGRFALMLFDIDKFKLINDKYGHGAGDTVLKTVVSRVRKVIRKADVLGRLGGDEFVIIQPMIRQDEDVLILVDRIFGELAGPVSINDDIGIKVAISIGICIYPDNATDETSILNNADSAMYEAKKEKGNSFRFFTKE